MTTSTLTKLLFHSLLVCLFVAGFTQPVQAQIPSFDLSVSPPLTHIIVQPGKTAVQTFTLKNNGGFEIQVTPELKDFTSDQLTGEPVLLENFTFPYLQIDGQSITDTFSLLPGTEKQFTIEFFIPESALEREHHFVLLFSTTISHQEVIESNSGKLNTQIGSNVIVTITRTEKDLGKLKLAQFQQWRIVDSFMAIEPKIIIENIGKNMTVPIGKLEISGVFTNQRFEQEILPQNVLPNAKRMVLAAKAESVDQVEYAQAEKFRYNPLALIGPYTLSFTYHSPNQSEELYEVTVFAFPFSIIILLIVSITGYLVYSRITAPDNHVLTRQHKRS